ncbi:hypothetical protein AB0M54_39500 [Actinoplanes sp. NPDC051470]|uniref:hypothetical protein n=1 Tax=unclassified Actinoplanes TaxID=2626549 RepID=UPI003421D3A1
MDRGRFLPAHLRVGTEPNAFGKAIDEQIRFWPAGSECPAELPSPDRLDIRPA